MFDGLIPGLGYYAGWLYTFARAQGLDPRVTSVRRTSAQQEALYRRYLAGQSQFPAAPPGRSLHERGLAFDMVTKDQGRTTGPIWNQMGGRWSPSDWVHYEYNPSRA
jgi:hypothetical protein